MRPLILAILALLLPATACFIGGDSQPTERPTATTPTRTPSTPPSPGDNPPRPTVTPTPLPTTTPVPASLLQTAITPGDCDQLLRNDLLLQTGATDASSMQELIAAVQHRQAQCRTQRWNPVISDPLPGTHLTCLSSLGTPDTSGVPPTLLASGGPALLPTSTVDPKHNILIHWSTNPLAKPADASRCWIYDRAEDSWTSDLDLPRREFLIRQIPLTDGDCTILTNSAAPFDAEPLIVPCDTPWTHRALGSLRADHPGSRHPGTPGTDGPSRRELRPPHHRPPAPHRALLGRGRENHKLPATELRTLRNRTGTALQAGILPYDHRRRVPEHPPGTNPSRRRADPLLRPMAAPAAPPVPSRARRPLPRGTGPLPAGPDQMRPALHPPGQSQPHGLATRPQDHPLPAAQHSRNTRDLSPPRPPGQPRPATAPRMLPPPQHNRPFPRAAPRLRRHLAVPNHDHHPHPHRRPAHPGHPRRTRRRTLPRQPDPATDRRELALRQQDPPLPDHPQRNPRTTRIHTHPPQHTHRHNPPAAQPPASTTPPPSSRTP